MSRIWNVRLKSVIIDIFKWRCPFHPQKREDMTHLKQGQLWVEFLSLSVVWEVWNGCCDKEEEQSISRGSIAKAPSREGAEWSNTHCLQRLCFKLLVTRKKKWWAKLSAGVAHLNSSRVIAGEVSAVAGVCPALRVQTAWEWLKNALGFYKRVLNSHLCVLSILNL